MQTTINNAIQWEVVSMVFAVTHIRRKLNLSSYSPQIIYYINAMVKKKLPTSEIHNKSANLNKISILLYNEIMKFRF